MIPYESEMLHGSPEWFAARKTHIGSSDVPILMGVGRKTRYRLFLEKHDYVQSSSNSAMRRGQTMEPIALAAYMAKTGYDVKARVLFGADDWYMCSFDGLSADGKHAVELKMAGADNHAIAMAGKVPEEYYPQLQHQLSGLEVDCMDYHSVPHFSDTCTDGVTVKVYRDDAYIKRMKAECQPFWEKSIIGGEMPELTHLDVIARIDDDWVIRAEQVRYLTQEIKDLSKRYIEPLEAEMKELRKELEAMAGDESCEGGGIRLTRIRRKGNLDADLLSHEIQDLDKYRKPATWSYRLDLDKKK